MKKPIAICLLSVLILLCACQPTPEEYADNKADGAMEDVIHAQTAPS